MILDTLADAARERTRARQKKISFAKMRHLAESLPQKAGGMLSKGTAGPGSSHHCGSKKRVSVKGTDCSVLPL